MDLNDPNRFLNRDLSSRERFLGVASHGQGSQNPSSSTAATGTEDEDLLEDDVLFSNNDYNNDEEDSAEPSSPTSQIPNNYHSHSHNHKAFAFGPPDVSLGIRAALPENDHTSPNASHFFHHKISVSLSTFSSSARLIPVIPKPPQHQFSSSPVKFYQSAPVNSRLLPIRRRLEFMEDDAVVMEERLPPHEIVARNSARRPVVAYSVLEGRGRTLKGRDLRQVRDAVFRITGFFDD